MWERYYTFALLSHVKHHLKGAAVKQERQDDDLIKGNTIVLFYFLMTVKLCMCLHPKKMVMTFKVSGMFLVSAAAVFLLSCSCSRLGC